MSSQTMGFTRTIGTTEWSLATDTSWSSADAQTTAGTYQLFLDLSALAAGDFFLLTQYETVLSGGTQIVFNRTPFNGATLNTPGIVLPAMRLLWGWDWSLKKLAGNDCSISWSIRGD